MLTELDGSQETNSAKRKKDITLKKYLWSTQHGNEPEKARLEIKIYESANIYGENKS